MEVDKKIIFISMENQKFVVEEPVARMSNLVVTMLEEVPLETKDVEIPLSIVKSKILAKIIDFCKYHSTPGNEFQSIKKPLVSNSMEKNLMDPFDVTFIEHCTQTEVFELSDAANFMGIDSLSDLVHAKISTYIMGKTPQDIRSLFGINNDFAEENSEYIKLENKWCSEE